MGRELGGWLVWIEGRVRRRERRRRKSCWEGRSGEERKREGGIRDGGSKRRKRWKLRELRRFGWWLVRLRDSPSENDELRVERGGGSRLLRDLIWKEIEWNELDASRLMVDRPPGSSKL